MRTILVAAVVAAMAIGCGTGSDAVVEGEDDAVESAQPDATSETGAGSEMDAVADADVEEDADVEADAAAEPDAAAVSACSHFRSMVEAQAAGSLSHEELRDALREIREAAEGSRADSIADSAEGMAVAATEGDAERLAQRLSTFESGCDALGL